MPSVASGNKIPRINLRTTPLQESLIKAADGKRGVSVTDFVLESACTRAEETIADQVHFVLSRSAKSEVTCQRTPWLDLRSWNGTTFWTVFHAASNRSIIG